MLSVHRRNRFFRPFTATALGLFLLGSSSMADAVIFGAILPSSRSVEVGQPATAFATIINAGSTAASNCGLALGSDIDAGFSYRTTDPATNAAIGEVDEPADIAAGGSQSYIFSIVPASSFSATDVVITFDCDNTSPAGVTTGINTLLLSASDSPIPDVVALAATLSGDGIAVVPGQTGSAAFAVATVNVGAGSAITVTVDSGATELAANLFVCETNPATGACISAVAPSISTTIDAEATPTFTVFVAGVDNIDFRPGTNRVYVRFKDGGGVTRGSTSVAVMTESNQTLGGIWEGTLKTDGAITGNPTYEGISADDGRFVFFSTTSQGQLQGNFSVEGNALTGSGFAVDLAGDGTVVDVVAVTLQGEIAGRESITADWQADSTGQSGTMAFSYSSGHSRASSLAKVEGGWVAEDNGSVSLELDVTGGTITGSDMFQCVHNGTVAPIDANFNVYHLELHVSDCVVQGIDRSGTYIGLGALKDTTVTDDTFILGIFSDEFFLHGLVTRE